MPGETTSAASPAASRSRPISAISNGAAPARAASPSSQQTGTAPPALSARAAASPERPRPSTPTRCPWYAVTAII